jgi:DNA gyrase subunit A
MAEFEIDSLQAEFIAEIKLRNLNREYVLNRIGEIGDLKSEIAALEEMIRSDAKIKNVIIKQLEYVSGKYAQPRKTEIVKEEHIDVITSDQLIDDYNLKLYLTGQNYLKKLPLVSLRANPELKLKEEDTIRNEVESHNKAELLLFSNKQTVYKLRIYEIEDCKPSELGIYLPNLLEMQEGEKILNITATDDYTGNMLFSFENGKVAKIDMGGYQTKTNRKKLANAYSDISPVVDIRHLKNDIDLVVHSSINKMLVFNTECVNVKTTRNSQGVQVLKQKKGSRMVRMETLAESGLVNIGYYSTKCIPAVGHYSREEDFTERQLALDIDKEMVEEKGKELCKE